MQRRNFLGGLAGILATGAAPAILSQGTAMKIYVPKILTPTGELTMLPEYYFPVVHIPPALLTFICVDELGNPVDASNISRQTIISARQSGKQNLQQWVRSKGKIPWMA